MRSDLSDLELQEAKCFGKFMKRMILFGDLFCVCVFWNVGHLSLISRKQETKTGLSLLADGVYFGFTSRNWKIKER